jgi:hypothetical protein
MPLLRKAGIRSPWQPGPLDVGVAPAADALRQTIVIGAIVPALLLGGNTEFIGRPAPPEDIQWPARPAVDQQGSVPVPGANVLFVGRPQRVEDVQWPARPIVELQVPPVPVSGASTWMPYPVREQVAAQPDRIAPTQLVVNQPPIPGAQAWMPSAARLPNTDPLRPPILITDAPDATLAQPNTTSTSRLSRDEDTSRPARPAVVIGVGVPVPGANVEALYAPRDVGVPPPDRLAPTQLIVSSPPMPGALTLPTGRITETPLLRLALTAVSGPPVPIPGAIVVSLCAPRDAAIVQPDRLALTQVIVSQPPQIGARALITGIVHDGDRLVSGAWVVTPPVPIPGAIAQRIGRTTATPTDPIRPLSVVVNQPPIPGSLALILGPAVGEGSAIIYSTDNTIVLAVRVRSAVLEERGRSADVTRLRTVVLPARLRVIVLAQRDRAEEVQE